tara:strand:- start:31584 stop:32387 length:804 start_codon:yes stop_codon:yes gene_type:complete
MSNLNFVLGLVHNSHLLDNSFVNRFKTLEIKNPLLKIPKKEDYLYHSNYSVSLEGVSKEIENDLKIIGDLSIRRFSFDVGPCYSSIISKNNKYYPGKNLIKKKDLINMTGEEINKLNKLFNNKTKLAVENLNYYDTGAYEEDVCIPEFYNEISEKFNIEQILDLAHLKVSAINLNKTFKSMLSRVNQEFVKEIHLTKIDIESTNSAIDSHLAPTEEEFSDLLIALENNPNNDIDIVIEAWRDTESLVKSFEDLYIYLRKNSKHKIIF